MTINLNRRLTALEATLLPSGRIIPVWSMKADDKVMTDEEFQQEIAARKAAGAPANGRCISFCWLTEREQASDLA